MQNAVEDEYSRVFVVRLFLRGNFRSSHTVKYNICVFSAFKVDILYYEPGLRIPTSR